MVEKAKHVEVLCNELAEIADNMSKYLQKSEVISAQYKQLQENYDSMYKQLKALESHLEEGFKSTAKAEDAQKIILNIDEKVEKLLMKESLNKTKLSNENKPKDDNIDFMTNESQRTLEELHLTEDRPLIITRRVNGGGWSSGYCRYVSIREKRADFSEADILEEIIYINGKAYTSETVPGRYAPLRFGVPEYDLYDGPYLDVVKEDLKRRGITN